MTETNQTRVTRYRLYTGPTLVQQLAEELRGMAYNVVVEGTENVLFDSPVDDRDELWFLMTPLHGRFRVNDLVRLGTREVTVLAQPTDAELEQAARQSERDEAGLDMARRVADYVNGRNADEFVKGMAQQHRTLQQSFTGLCVAWFEYLASRQPGQYDLRNQDSVDLAKEIVASEEWINAKYLRHI